MATDLPVLPVQKQHYSSLVDQNNARRQLFSSAVHVRFPAESGRVLPSVKTAHCAKRDREEQHLQVKFAPEVTLATVDVQTENQPQEAVFEKSESIIPETVLNVDHDHYEQWARVPGKRGPNSSLLRGIQALKARMKRESMEQERTETVNAQNKFFHINTLTRNSLMTRDKMSEDSSHRRREKKCSILPKPPSEPRCSFKANAHIIDAEMFKHLGNLESRKTLFNRQDRIMQREATKPRFGVAKIRDRCALPISVYQPVSIGDHVFLINEPFQFNEYVKLKARPENDAKKDSKSGNMSDAASQEMKQEIMPDTDSIERSKTFTSGFSTAKSNKRPRALVSSAELFDFSQLSEIRHSMEGKFMERSKTEFSFASKGSKTFKLVPNVRRLKDRIKA